MDRNAKMMKLESLSVPRMVFSNIIPSIISMLMVLFYNLADAFFIGQTKDPLMFAAVNVATPAFFIFMAIGMLFGIGGTSLISRRFGERKDEEARHASSFCFYTGIGCGLIGMVLILLFMTPVCRLVGASDATLSYTKDYLQYVSFGIPFLIFGNMFSNIIRAEGRATTAMLGMIIGNMINIILDPILILYLDMGTSGAAIATLIGNLSSAAFYFAHLLSKRTRLSIKLKDYKARDGIAMGVLAIGIPASLNSILMSSSNIMLNNVMGSYDDLAVAGLGVAMKVNMIVVMLLIGIGGGVQPLFGYFFGAGNKKRYMEIFRFSMILAIIVSIVMSIICYFGADFLVRTFLDNDDAYAYAFSFSRKYIISGPILGILFILMNAIQATGAAIPALVLSISRQGLVFIPVLYTLNAVFHTESVVALSQPITDYIAILMSVAVFFFVYRKYIMRLKPRGQVNDTKQVVHSD